jgi:hypothetical protein
MARKKFSSLVARGFFCTLFVGLVGSPTSHRRSLIKDTTSNFGAITEIEFIQVQSCFAENCTNSCLGDSDCSCPKYTCKKKSSKAGTLGTCGK